MSGLGDDIFPIDEANDIPDITCWVSVGTDPSPSFTIVQLFTFS
jgi:hypothetical protein